VFVVDASDKIIYKEIVSEVTQEPNYEAALQAASKQAAGVH
jgi:thiol peroxidase